MTILAIVCQLLFTKLQSGYILAIGVQIFLMLYRSVLLLFTLNKVPELYFKVF